MAPEVDELVELAVVALDAPLAREVRDCPLVVLVDAAEHSTRLDEQPQFVVRPVKPGANSLMPGKLGMAGHRASQFTDKPPQRDPSRIGGIGRVEQVAAAPPYAQQAAIAGHGASNGVAQEAALA